MLLYIHVRRLFCDWLERLLWGRLFAMKRLHTQSQAEEIVRSILLFGLFMFLSSIHNISHKPMTWYSLFVLRESLNANQTWNFPDPISFLDSSQFFNTLRQTYRNIISNWCIIFLRFLVLYFINLQYSLCIMKTWQTVHAYCNPFVLHHLMYCKTLVWISL